MCSVAFLTARQAGSRRLTRPCFESQALLHRSDRVPRRLQNSRLCALAVRVAPDREANGCFQGAGAWHGAVPCERACAVSHPFIPPSSLLRRRGKQNPLRKHLARRRSERTHLAAAVASKLDANQIVVSAPVINIFGGECFEAMNLALAYRTLFGRSEEEGCALRGAESAHE